MMMMSCGAPEQGGLSEPEAVQKDAQRAHSEEVRGSSRGPEPLRRAGDQGTRLRGERRSRREKRRKGFVSYLWTVDLILEESHSEILNGQLQVVPRG